MCQLPADQNERVIVYDRYMITLFGYGAIQFLALTSQNRVLSETN